MQHPQPMNRAQRSILIISLLVIAVVAVLFVVLNGGAPKPPAPTASPKPTYATVDEAMQNLPLPTVVPTLAIIQTATPGPSLPPTPSPLPRPDSLVTLKRKDTGDGVRYLQRKLIELGYLAPGSDDGDFGSGTENAVREFQRRNDIKVDGIAGAATQTAMYAPEAVRK